MKTSMKSSISASISSSRMALAAWSMSIIIARWKWATAPATASRRWNVSRRRAVAKAQPSAELMVDPGRGARCAIRDTGRVAKAVTIGLLPYSARLIQLRRGGLGASGGTRRGGTPRLCGGPRLAVRWRDRRQWLTHHWLRSSGACRHAMIEKKPGDHFSSSSSDFASFRSGVSKPSVNQP